MIPPGLRRGRAALILLVAAGLGLAWLLQLDFSRKISTDVLDLLPTQERSPELGLVRSLASEAEARVMFFVLHDATGGAAPAGAARRFAGELARRPEFETALELDDPAARDAMGAALFERRFALLFPHWLAEHEAADTAGNPADWTNRLATRTADELGRFLASPQALAFGDLIPADPLLLLPGVVNRAQGALALVAPAGDAPATAGPGRVWARIAASPLREEGQQPVFAAIAAAAAAARAEYPGLQVDYTGVNRFAAASKARIQKELSWLNTLSLVAVLAVALLFIRGAHRALHLVPPVVLATLGAWVCVTLAFSRVHILVFVIGALLTGVAIDYGFYLYMQTPGRPDEVYWEKVRRLAKPLLSSCFTTVAGFALLLFSNLPLIRQLGAFVGAGLVCALGAAILYFSLLGNTWLQARTFTGRPFLTAPIRRGIRVVLVTLWIAALPGLFRLQWKDDIRELEIPSPEVQRLDASVRAQFGDAGDRTVFLTYGPTLGEARTALGQLESWLKGSGGAAAEFANLGAAIPTPAEHAHAVSFVREHPEFPARLRAALAGAGFEEEGFAPFFTAYATYAAGAAERELEPAIQGLQAKLAGPISLLVHSGDSLAWFVTLVRTPPAGPPPADTHTINANQLQSLNRIFAEYRQSALWLSLTGLAIVGAGVFATYGLKDGARIFAIPCGICLGLFGVFGWTGQPLNLFHLLGAFLGVCLTHNYSIFSADSAYRHEPPPASVRLSGLCTSASFGTLALSSIPVVRALGATVALMVLAALIAIEFEHFTPLAKKPRA